MKRSVEQAGHEVCDKNHCQSMRGVTQRQKISALLEIKTGPRNNVFKNYSFNWSKNLVILGFKNGR